MTIDTINIEIVNSDVVQPSKKIKKKTSSGAKSKLANLEKQIRTLIGKDTTGVFFEGEFYYLGMRYDVQKIFLKFEAEGLLVQSGYNSWYRADAEGAFKKEVKTKMPEVRTQSVEADGDEEK